MLIGLTENDPEGQLWVSSFLEELQKLGWKSGVDVQTELRWRRR
jgi:hypothetical protein